MALRHEIDDHDLGLLAEAPRPPLRLVDAPPADSAMEVEASGLFLRAVVDSLGAALRSPGLVAGAVGELATGLLTATTASLGRAVGREVDGPVAPARDARFADPTWEDNAAYWWLRQVHHLNERFVGQVIDAAPIDDRTRAKARFAAGLTCDALAPTNTLAGNPAALTRAFQTGGLSLLRGARNLADDVAHNGGWPTQVDGSTLEVGRDLAGTGGQVVHRSHFIEVIQYRPRTEAVHEVPLLFCPPWINKYYILDLAPGRSLVEWALEHGHQCFVISYRNPDATLRDATFDDYLREGPRRAIEVVKEITGSDVVNTMSVCLGGTLSAMSMALDAARDDRSVNSASFINTHTDFTRAGVLGTFTDDATVRLLERHLRQVGTLDQRHIAHTFSLLRANDLVFGYVAKNWLMGDTPPAFDLLAWNADGTDMPGRLHADFLRWCYVENRLARGAFEVEGTRLDLGRISQPTYVVSAVDDHIVPWNSAYQTTQLFGGEDKRFVLSTSGHIAAIVNPPGPKAKHWVNPALPADAEDWLADAELRTGTWWDDWAGWIGDRAGPMVEPPTHLGSDRHPPIGDAPGVYVHGLTADV
ncbi:PHA/PHB synthase family protein [Rhabdothermincola salaria]|uniref:PHA/PHB synthase family protein n=1 Tax=Rhabdothermincola salaria TaxID=2903142 RepID=UPI001E2966EE|nr:alpha/beta fold hydrolase [Rhabdothermincola salaria]MCD9623982.1 hypothetical protein [Rhabdothermincola salaria]